MSTDWGIDGATAMRGAPSLPFRGVIGYYGSVGIGPFESGYPEVLLDSPIPDGLLYRSAEDSSLSYVPLGDMTYICGPGAMIARSDGVEVFHVRGVGPFTVGYLIPWGDDAYPQLLFSSEAFWQLDKVNVNDSFQVELVLDDDKYTYGVLRVSKGAEQRFYSVPILRFLGSEFIAPAREVYGRLVELSGTDGEHYGYHSIPYEPACGPQMTFVVSAVTGELVMCGWDLLGPLLVNLDESHPGVEDAVFPVDDPSMSASDCRKRANVFGLYQGASGDSEGAAP